MKEIWKNIIGYEGYYQVSNLGRVKSLKRYSKYGQNNKTRILKYALDGKGYPIVSFCKDYSKVTVKIHRLVAEAFIPNSENKPEVNHKDGVKIHNEETNLEWVTSSENNNHAIKTKLRKIVKGEKHGNSKLTEIDVLKIRNSNLNNRILADMFRVDIHHIRDIKSNKVWRHI